MTLLLGLLIRREWTQDNSKQYEQKTKEPDSSFIEFIENVENVKKREDAYTLSLKRQVTQRRCGDRVL